ncbi:MAG: fructose-bisphosphate aldolase class I [Legionellaceae bacterium]|nr:fructose-bisphosphate aldolase class I [Legionellaceae bacterium]
MYYDELSTTMEHLLQEGKGILAADESNGTIGKRFDTINLENTAENRQDYRLLLATAPEIESYISGAILFEETFENKDVHGTSVPKLLQDKGILPGIKVDKGLSILANTHDEKVTLGLDELSARLQKYKDLGAKFAKWRNVYSISEFTPSLTAIKAGAEMLARYAASCQMIGLVPIVEPEVLNDGTHTIEQCAEASEMVLHELFNALFIHQVELEHIVLKPSMVTCGKDAPKFSSPEDVADFTLSVFRNTVFPAVPTINFLSGGQTPTQATANLNAINNAGYQAWALSFSYGRALQEDCLKAWGGNAENIPAAQAALLHRARLNSLACFGEYNASME